MVNLGNDWDEILKDEFQKDYYRNLRKFLADEYRKCVVYPNMYDIFNALRYTSFENTRAVILGQDPYHGPHQAHGLCFSVLKGIAPPPSLKNIFRELSDDVGFIPPHHGELTEWAKQGVLMLNSVLTVREHQPNSHKGMGIGLTLCKTIVAAHGGTISASNHPNGAQFTFTLPNWREY